MAARKRVSSEAKRVVNIDALIAKVIRQDHYLIDDIVYSVSDRIQDELHNNVEDVVRDRINQVFDEVVEKLAKNK